MATAPPQLDPEEETLDLRRYLDILLRWWWLILLGPVVAGLAAYVFSVNQTPQYQASTLVLVRQTRGSALPNMGDLQLSRALASTYREVITTRRVLDAAAGEVDPALSGGSIKGRIDVSLRADTSILEVGITDADPARAAEMSNAVADAFIRITREDQLEEIARLQSAAASQGVSNSQEILTAQVNALASLSVVEPARAPESPVSPSVGRNTLLGMVLGGLVAVMGAFGLEYLNDTTRRPEEVERRLGLTRISTILRWRPGEVGPQDIVVLSQPHSMYSEAYRQARVNLQFLSSNEPPRRYLITSAGPGAGKSTFAVNLAASLTQDGRRVVLVDGDFRRPSVHHYFPFGNQQGLSTLLASHDLNVRDVLQATHVEGLQVLPSGPLPPNPVELLGSARMDAVLEELSTLADIVVMDSPPVMAVADSLVLASKGVETILMTSPETRMEALSEAYRALQKTHTRMLGFVLNRFRAPRMGYGYHYYYYYYYHSYSAGRASTNGTGHGPRSVAERVADAVRGVRDRVRG